MLRLPIRQIFLSTLLFLTGVEFEPSFATDTAAASETHHIGINFSISGTGDDQEKRLQAIKGMNVDVLRLDEGEWRAFEDQSSNWVLPSPLTSFFQKESQHQFSFLLKSAIGSFQAPPKWYLQLHPDAQLVGRSGAPNETPITSSNVISYWYPQLHLLLQQKDQQIFDILQSAGDLTSIAYLIVPGGPASEPIYPAPWTTSDPNGPARFWLYDKNAQAQFRTAMLSKYKTIARANTRWHTNFLDWSSVDVPLPGTSPGPMWADILTWYRDSKRAFFHWQIRHYQELVRHYWPKRHRPQLLILVPGTHYTAASWNEAVNSGSGDNCIRSMCDSTFLLDEAQQAGAAVQYTGMPKMSELEFLQSYIKSHKYSVRVWGENVGGVGQGSELANEALLTGLSGQEYIGNDLFYPSQSISTTRVSELIAAFARLRAIWTKKEEFLVSVPALTIIEGACVHLDVSNIAFLCLQQGNLILREGDRVVWSAESQNDGVGAHCGHSGETCTAVFQGDGNFVVYSGSTATWASNTTSRGRLIQLSSAPPFVSILDKSGKVIWAPSSLTAHAASH